MFMPTFVIKFIELAIAVACLVLQQYSYDLTDVPTLVLCSGTYVGFILVLSGEIVGEVLTNKQDPFVEAWWTGGSAVLFGACAVRTLQDWRHVPDCSRRARARASAMCALANTSVLIVDAIRVLCSDDGSTVKSEKIKIKKQKYPKNAFEFTAPMKSPFAHYTAARLLPAKVPLTDINAGNTKTGKIDANNTRTFTGVAKITPHKIPLKKFPAACKPLRMAPKQNRSFW